MLSGNLRYGVQSSSLRYRDFEALNEVDSCCLSMTTTRGASFPSRKGTRCPPPRDRGSDRGDPKRAPRSARTVCRDDELGHPRGLGLTARRTTASGVNVAVGVVISTNEKRTPTHPSQQRRSPS